MTTSVNPIPNIEFQEPNHGVSQRKQQRRLFKVKRFISRLGKWLDEGIWTNIRIFSVFCSHLFAKLTGHFIIDAVITGVSVVVSAVLDRLLKNKKIQTLQDFLIANEREFGSKRGNDGLFFLQEMTIEQAKELISLQGFFADKNKLEIAVNDESQLNSSLLDKTKLRVLRDEDIQAIERQLNKHLNKKGSNHSIRAKVEPRLEEKKRWVRKGFRLSRVTEFAVRYDVKYVINGTLADLLSKRKYTNFKFVDVFEHLFGGKLADLAKEELEPEKKNDTQYLIRKYLINILNQFYLEQSPKSIYSTRLPAALAGQATVEKSLKDVLNDFIAILGDYTKKETEKETPSEKLEKLLKAHGSDADKLLAFYKIIPLFFDKAGNLRPDITLIQSRQEFIENLNKLSLDAKSVAGEIYSILIDASFQFWLFWMAAYIFVDNNFNLALNLATMGAGLGLAAINAGVHFANKRRNKARLPELIDEKKSDDKEENKKKKALKALEHVDDKLKCEGFEYLFIKQLKRYSNCCAENDSEYNRISKEKINQELNADIDSIIEAKSAEQVQRCQLNNLPAMEPGTKAAKQFLNTRLNYYVEKLKSYTTKEKFTRPATALATVMGTGVAVSFLEWFLTNSISVISVTLGSILSVGAFLIGMIAGIAYYIFKVSKDISQRKAKLKAEYEAKRSRIEKLLTLEAQNKRLEQLLKEKMENYVAEKQVDPADNHALARGKTGPKTFGEKFKAVFKAIMYIIARIGSGVLLFRLSLKLLIPLLITNIAALSKIAVLASIASAMTAATWPVAIVALGIGLIWAGIYFYNRYQEIQLKNAEKILTNVENRISKEKDRQKRLLRRLGRDTHSKKQFNPDGSAEAASDGILLNKRPDSYNHNNDTGSSAPKNPNDNANQERGSNNLTPPGDQQVVMSKGQSIAPKPPSDSDMIKLDYKKETRFSCRLRKLLFFNKKDTSPDAGTQKSTSSKNATRSDFFSALEKAGLNPNDDDSGTEKTYRSHKAAKVA